MPRQKYNKSLLMLAVASGVIGILGSFHVLNQTISIAAIVILTFLMAAGATKVNECATGEGSPKA